MDRLVANYGRMAALADELSTLVSRLELGDSHYLRQVMRLEVTGSAEVTEACSEFEDHWAFGRDRISTSLEKLIGFLSSAALEYAESDGGAASMISAIGDAMKQLPPDRKLPSQIGESDGESTDLPSAYREYLETRPRPYDLLEDRADEIEVRRLGQESGGGL